MDLTLLRSGWLSICGNSRAVHRMSTPRACLGVSLKYTELTHLPLDKMDDMFERIFFNKNDRIPLQNWLNFVPRSPTDNKPALVR